MPDDNDRTEGRSISLPRSLWDHLTRRARDDGKTLSAVVRELVEVDQHAMRRTEEVES